MNKKSSLKKKSSLLPFLALPAAGALAGGAYYWQQNNGEDAGLSKQEKAKRLLRCLILGGATGLGAATAYTGGKMTYDNLIKNSSYKKKATKNTLLKQLVKKSSKKRNLLKLLVKQAYEQIPEYDGNINSNYLIGGGLGLLGGLGLYHFLNNEEAKKKGLGGYIGAGLTGLSAGLLGAGAYNQTQHGKLFDEKNENGGMYITPYDPDNPRTPKTPGKKYRTGTYNGKTVYLGKNRGMIDLVDDDTASSSGGGSVGGGSGTGAGTGLTTGEMVGATALTGVATALGAATHEGNNRANIEANNSKSTNFGKQLAANTSKQNRHDRPYFGRPKGTLDTITSVIAKPFRAVSNGAEWATANLLGNNNWKNLFSEDKVKLYEQLAKLQNEFTLDKANALLSNYSNINGSRGQNILKNTSSAFQPLFDPTNIDFAGGYTTDAKGNQRYQTGTQRWISESDIPFAEKLGKTGTQNLVRAHNWLQLLKAVQEQAPDTVIQNNIALAEAAYKDALNGKITYGDLASTPADSPIKEWKYNADAKPEDLKNLVDSWGNRASWPEADIGTNLDNILKYKSSLPDTMTGELDTFLKNNLEARFNNLKNSPSNSTLSDAELYKQISTDKNTPKAIQDIAKKKLSEARQLSQQPLKSRLWDTVKSWVNRRQQQGTVNTPPISEPETSEIHTTDIPEEYRRLMEAVEQAKQNAADRAKVPPIPDTTPIPQNDVSAPSPTPGNVNNEAPSGSKPITGSGTPTDYKGYDYERLQKEVDTLDRAWNTLENARIKGTLNEEGKKALATTESQLDAARKELRSRPEFKTSLNTPLPFGPNKPPKGTEAPKPNPVTNTGRGKSYPVDLKGLSESELNKLYAEVWKDMRALGKNILTPDTPEFNEYDRLHKIQNNVLTELYDREKNTSKVESETKSNPAPKNMVDILTQGTEGDAPKVPPTETSTPEAQKGTETGQNKQIKTKQDAINKLFSNSEPTPGSHYDENWRTVVDDPIVYQKELEKELSRIDKTLENPEKLDITKRKELDVRRSWLQKFLKGLKERAIRAGEALVEGGKRFAEGVKHK